MNYLLLALIFIILIITAWALMGRGEAGEAGAEVPPEKQFRRRATDQEIEKAFPEEKLQRGRRASDRAAGAPRGEGGGETADGGDGATGEDFKLPYSADEIIPESSRFRIYTRTLLNSEIYAQKGDYDTAISLYQGVNERINDESTNRKIDANIAYLNNYRDFSEKRRKEKEAISKQFQERRGNEIRVSIDGPLTIPEKIQIGVATPIQNIEKDKQIDIDKIVEEITSKLMGSDMFARGSKAGPRPLPEQAIARPLPDEHAERARAKDIPETALKDQENALRGLQDKLKIIEDRVEDAARDSARARDDIRRMKEIEEAAMAASAREADRGPSITAPKYSSPIPVTLDTKPIIDLLNKLPARQVPEATPMKPPPSTWDARPAASQATTPSAKARGAEGTGKEAPSPAARGGGEAERSKEAVDREINTSEGEGPEDYELFSEYLKDGKDDTDGGLSDADIFEKILQEDREKIQDSFEIRGERRDRGEGAYDISDDEYERKRRDDERFYEKFLKHEKRIRKELPILRVTYDFSRLPDEFSLSKDKNILEYSLYKYKPLLEKAEEFIKRRRVRDAINYYRTVMSQNVPPEFKVMIRKNIDDLTEYLEKYLASE